MGVGDYIPKGKPMSETLDLLKIIDKLREPRHFTGEPKMFVTVSGYWADVIGAFWNDKPRWERLLNSKPDCEDDDDSWRVYFIPFETMDELHEILTLVRAKKLKHAVHLQMKGEGHDCYAMTADHYKRDGKASYSIGIEGGEL
jgi:hypothetical protein